MAAVAAAVRSRVMWAVELMMSGKVSAREVPPEGAMASSSASNLRLMSDLKTMKQSPPEGVSASPLGDENLHVWGGTVFGTDDTAWEGGIFSMRLTFPEQYPDKPPRVRFTSEMVRGARR